MILSDRTLKLMIESGELYVDPLKENSIQPASIDCHLGDHYLIVDDFNMGTLKLDEEIRYREVVSETLTLPPRSFLLATTAEYVKMPKDLTAFVEGRSSIGRMGLLFKMLAGWTLGLRGASPWSFSTPTPFPSSCKRDDAYANWCFAKWTSGRTHPMRANTKAKANPWGAGSF